VAAPEIMKSETAGGDVTPGGQTRPDWRACGHAVNDVSLSAILKNTRYSELSIKRMAVKSN